MLKADGTFRSREADLRAVPAQPAELDDAADPVVEDGRPRMVVRSVKGDDRSRSPCEVLSDVTHEMDFDADRLPRTAWRPTCRSRCPPRRLGEGFRLVRREWPTDVGPVDLMCRDEADGWVAVEIKRIGTIDAVSSSRYLERIRLDPAKAGCRGVLAAQVVKPQARVLADSRGLSWVEVDSRSCAGARARAHAVSLTTRRDMGAGPLGEPLTHQGWRG